MQDQQTTLGWFSGVNFFQMEKNDCWSCNYSFNIVKQQIQVIKYYILK